MGAVVVFALLTLTPPDAQRAAALAAYKQSGLELQVRTFAEKTIDKPYSLAIQYTYQVAEAIQKKEITYGWEF